MTVDVTTAIAAYLAGNRGPTVADPDARERPDYGLSASLDGAVIDLSLTFRAGSAYCCAEWPCHFLLFPTRRWDRLRRELSALGLDPPSRLGLSVKVVVEAGTLFLAPRRSWRTPAALVPSKAFRYQETVTEGDQPEISLGMPAPDIIIFAPGND